MTQEELHTHCCHSRGSIITIFMKTRGLILQVISDLFVM